MDARFYVDGYSGSLGVETAGEREALITTRFMQSDNSSRAADYLRGIATQLNELYKSDIDAAGELLDFAYVKVDKAKLAEKFMEEVNF